MENFEAVMAKILNGVRDAHHGDVQYFSCSKLPEGAVEIEKTFIAKSEVSGHSHVACGDYKMFDYQGRTFIAVGEDGATMNHIPNGLLNVKGFTDVPQKEAKGLDHGNDVLPKGIYFVGIQQRVDPYKGTWEKVKD